MYDNVLILGAGASVDAGIPLLNNFVEEMMAIAIRQNHRGRSLLDGDGELFTKCYQIWKEIGNYHRRSNIDDWNLEDILSILEFNSITGNADDKESRRLFVKGISRAIDLFCTAEELRENGKYSWNGSSVYISLWDALFSHFKNDMPCIITTNYDLVLERSLYAALRKEHYDAKSFPNGKCKVEIDYGIENNENIYVTNISRILNTGTDRQHSRRTVNHFSKHNIDSVSYDSEVSVRLLKLHGSINFNKPTTERPAMNINSYTDPCDDPTIVPPNFNKSSLSGYEEIWKQALSALRTARNVVVCGYSLPLTDVYMQYFLKTACGPNDNLSKITVYDIAHYREGYGDRSEDMKQRYYNCFASNFHGRMYFNPETLSSDDGGTLVHLVNTINRKPGSIFHCK